MDSTNQKLTLLLVIAQLGSVESSTRKVNITKATELCPQHIKSQNHFTIEEKARGGDGGNGC
jgi:hypothetical protein